MNLTQQLSERGETVRRFLSGARAAPLNFAFGGLLPSRNEGEVVFGES